MAKFVIETEDEDEHRRHLNGPDLLFAIQDFDNRLKAYYDSHGQEGLDARAWLYAELAERNLTLYD